MEQIHPKHLLEVKGKNNWIYNKQQLTPKQINHLSIQARTFLETDLYKIIDAALQRHAIKVGLLDSSSLEENMAGKAMVRTRDVINTMLTQMANNKP